MIMIDVPQVAYKTWCLEYRVVKNDGTRDRMLEQEMEQSLKNALQDVRYSAEHDHVI